MSTVKKSQASNRQKPAQPSEHCSIRWLQGRTRRLSAQDGDLVAEHDDLDGQVVAVAPSKEHQLEDSDKSEVEKRQGHGPVWSPQADLRNP